jgi:3-methyladenine DNA glycosylase AlkD
VTSFEIGHVRRALADHANPADAPAMSAYMKHRYVFFGVKSPQLRRATADVLAEARTASADRLLTFAAQCWAEDEREFQYVGADVLKAGHRALGPEHLDPLAQLVTTKSWWDTVDVLASWPVGSIVGRHPETAAVMDRWIDDDDIWIARTAILHQLRRKDTTDVDRLFDYALRRGGDTEFFIRKAIGWALRQYAHVDAARVAAFVHGNESRLAPLTRREALKNVERTG